MTSKYIHQQIISPRSIRVLTLLPSRSHERPLCGMFSEHGLDSSTSASFEALSYMWGSTENPGTITIVKQNHPKSKQIATQLTITSNCESALRRLRYRFQPRRVWVDAICIDQDSVLEKNEQVALMVDIFYNAKKVLVWLQVENEEEARTRDVFRLIRLVDWLYRTNCLRLRDTDDDSQSNLAKETLLIRACEKYVRTKELGLIGALHVMFMNRYFRRIWTIQEIAMAHQVKVYYGAFSFTWPKFVTCATSFILDYDHLVNESEGLKGAFTTMIEIMRGLDAHFVQTNKHAVEAFHDKQNQRTIVEKLGGEGTVYLLRSKGLEATEPRDQAYAMLWLFRSFKYFDPAAPIRKVDYTKSLETVYTEYTVALILRGFQLQFILSQVSSASRKSSLPSWVPDWNETTTSLLNAWTGHLLSYEASKTSQRYGYHGDLGSIENNLLRIWGLEYSKIKIVIRQDPSDKQDAKNSSLEPNSTAATKFKLSKILRDITDISQKLFGLDREQLMKGLYGAFIIGNTQEKIHVTQEEHLIAGHPGISIDTLKFHVFSLLTPLIEHALSSPETQCVKESLLQLFPEEKIDAVFNAAEKEKDLPPFLFVLHGLSIGTSWFDDWLSLGVIYHSDKDFFITESGNIGIAYQGVQKGDLVTIWRGHPCPTIVREKRVDGMEAYHFHGLAYVEGIMNGEAWPDTEEGLQEFILI